MTRDPLLTLREYRALAPWNLRDLAAVAAAILDLSGVRPVNAAASAHPNERTIRFYVTRGLVAPPDGRGTAATYGYRHLLQVLGIKLRQMEGATLGAITREAAEMTGDVLERRVAAALGPALPGPDELPLAGGAAAPSAGRTFQAMLARVPEPEVSTESAGPWFRVPVAPGVELLLSTSHPLVAAGEHLDTIAESVRLAIGRMMARTDRAG